jgi:hypothetical protein
LTYTVGYGSLTAGHLDLTMSYKTFGTLGQGLAADQNTYDDSTGELGVAGTETTAGVQHMIITFIPVSDNVDTSKTAKAKVMGKTFSSVKTMTSSYFYPYSAQTNSVLLSDEAETTWKYDSIV